MLHWRPDHMSHVMHSWTRDTFEISTDPQRLHVALIQEFLARTYWSPGIPMDIVQRGIQGALCFGVYEEGHQVGFARVVTDRATFAYLCDVFVLPAWRGRGVSKFLMETILAHPELQYLRRWMLATADAHGLYEQFGFKALARPDRIMEIVTPDIYQRLGFPDPRDPG
jgi:GNAT superfamily N-acetyltransferase